jgi:hypothetical protein
VEVAFVKENNNKKKPLNNQLMCILLATC